MLQHRIILFPGQSVSWDLLTRFCDSWRFVAGPDRGVTYTEDYNDEDNPFGPYEVSVGEIISLTDPDGVASHRVDNSGSVPAILESVLNQKMPRARAKDTLLTIQIPLSYAVSQLHELEDLAREAAFESVRHQIGGNFPPEVIEEIAGIAAEGRKLLTRNPKLLSQEDIESLRDRLIRYTNVFSEGFVQEAGKEAGKEIGKNVGRAIAWSLLAAMALALSTAIKTLGLLELFL